MSTIQLLKSPMFKGKGFNPSPIARGGIPPEADSRLNPRVVGTPEWESFWNDQIFCITHGIHTGNLFIPGRYYYYLNYNSMAAAGQVILPDMVDIHLELTYVVEHCIANGKHLICGKKRRVGASEYFKFAKLDYDFRFRNGGYQAGIAAGQDLYIQDLMRKWRHSDSQLPPELRVKKLKDNDDLVIGGYKFRGESGDLIEGGTRNVIYTRTMKQNPALFKGLALVDIMAEECGEFEHLEKFYSHSLPCLKDGSILRGNMWFWGTGGNMNKGSKDFQKMWHEAEENNFVKFLITAERFHKPFYGGCTIETPQTPNLLKDHKPYEIIGVEDTKAAYDAIVEERKEIMRGKNSEKYQEHLKDYPLTEADIFRKTIVNAFDTDAMNNQMDAIMANPKKYVRCQLEYKRNEKGEIKFPLEVELRIDNSVTEDGICYLVHIDWMGGARKQYTNLLCAGLDGYDQDLSRTSKSKGAMCVIVRRNNIPNSLQLAPIATICCRPEKKEQFYEMCVKLSIFFDLHENVLCDVRSAGVINYFQQKGLERYLAYRPKKYESENSEQTHTWGISLNNYSKPLMLGEMQAGVDYFCDQIWFPELLNQLQNFDIAYIGSDNDLGDAYGMALMQDQANQIQPRDSKAWSDKEMYELGGEFKTNENGDIVPAESNPFKGEEHDHPNLWNTL
jgi:hypothetical protein